MARFATLLLVYFLGLTLSAAQDVIQSGDPGIVPSSSAPAPLATAVAPAVVQGAFVAANASDLTALSDGNARFRADISNEAPGLLAKLAEEGQSPTSVFIGCADSRVSEGTIMDAPPGSLFVTRQISNQYLSSDAATRSVIAYGVDELRVRHVILTGHIGCGGVAAAMIPPPPAPMSAAEAAVQSWVQPIRELFAASTDPVIVAKRAEVNALVAAGSPVEEPAPGDPAFDALVKENIKKGVEALVADPIIANSWAEFRAASSEANVAARARRRARRLTTRAEGEAATAAEAVLPQEVVVHGFLYDIRDGTLHDLGLNVGPNGPLNVTPAEGQALVRRVKREHRMAAHRH